MARRKDDPWQALDELRHEADYVDRPGQRAILLSLADRIELRISRPY